MALDLATINAAMYAVVKSSATICAATGPGTSAGVIPAHELSRPLPARPFLAWRGGVVSGQSHEMRGVNGSWWVYDDPGQGYYRIDALIALIEEAYPPDAIADGRTTVQNISGQQVDAALGGLHARSIGITYRRLA